MELPFDQTLSCDQNRALESYCSGERDVIHGPLSRTGLSQLLTWP